MGDQIGEGSFGVVFECVDGWNNQLAVKVLNVGSMGGLAAAKRGECDIAPVHLMDPQSGEYNRSFLVPGLELVSGYRRLQGTVFRPNDPMVKLGG